MSTGSCLRYTAVQVPTTGNQGPLTFFGALEPVLGLRTANITFTRATPPVIPGGAVVTTTGTFTPVSGPPFSFTIAADVTGSTTALQLPPGSPLTITRPTPDLCNGVNCSFLISYLDRASGERLEYELTFVNGTTPDAFLIAVYGTVCVPDNDPNDIPLPEVDPEVSPNISGVVHLSNDGQMICQVTYTVVQEFDGCCDGLIRSVRTFTEYKVNIQDVMKGKGCTLRQRIDSIAERGCSIDFELFVQYSVLRLILSQLLECKPFGKFDVNLLRKRYRVEFEKRLAESVYAKYFDYFFGPLSDVSDYWKFFKE
jgi:hypothetical protein